MKNKGTWVLFSVVVLLSLYTYFVEYQGKESEKTKQEQQSVIFKSFKEDQVNVIEINNLEQKITLERGSDGWKVTAPLSDVADNGDIEGLIKELVGEKTISTAVEGTDIQWQYFGFDQPAKSITLKTNSNQQLTIEVSPKKNFESNCFIRIPGENKVMVAGPGWGEYANKKLFDVRNKHIFRHQVSNVQSFSVNTKKGSVDIENKEAKWIASKQPSLALDQNLIRDTISKISEIRATEFTSEKEAIAATKSKLKLGASVMHLQVKLTEGDWNAQFYQAADKTVYAEVPKLQLLVKIPNDGFDKLLSLSVEELRDFKLPFAGFDRAKSAKVSYETLLKQANLVKKGTVWELEPADTVNEVQQDKVHALLEVLKNLTAKRYVTKAEIKKDISKQKVIIKDSSDQMYFELNFSEPETKKVNNEDKSVRYAKTNLYPDVFVLDELEFEKLHLNDLIKIKISNEGKADAHAK